MRSLGPAFLRLLIASGAASVGLSMTAAALAYEIYDVTRRDISVGHLGLAEAVPAILLSLFGGYLADRYDRKKIILTCVGFGSFVVLAMWLSAGSSPGIRFIQILAAAFAIGIAGGLSRPALSAIEAQVVPAEHALRGASILSVVGTTCAIAGPALFGQVAKHWSVGHGYLVAGSLWALSWFFILSLHPTPTESHPPGKLFEGIGEAIRFVWKSQVLLGSMALDLFAVFFGGAVALIPVFCRKVLFVGPETYGLLVAATPIGAGVAMLVCAIRPPTKNPGWLFLGCVTGFGLSIIGFAYSRWWVLSGLCLLLSGVFDGISMVIRRTILRVYSPEKMRGRVAAVSWIFIGASNELGALESGYASEWFGPVKAVLIGGIITLTIVAIAMIFAPKLRTIDLGPREVEA